VLEALGLAEKLYLVRRERLLMLPQSRP